MVWYEEGLRFRCTGCGRCCTGGPGYVWVTEQEIETMAAQMNLPLDLFYRRYIRRVGQRFSLIERKNGDCIFLRNGKECELYTARPEQCRTFPFWPLSLRSRDAWNQLAKDCEGVDHPEGDVYTAKEIQGILDGQQQPIV